MNLPTIHLVEAVWVVVECFTPHVPHVSEHLVAHWHGDTAPCIANGGASGEAVGRLQAHGANSARTKLLCDFCQHGLRLPIDDDVELKRSVEFWKRTTWELDVDHRSGDCDDAS